MKLRIAQIAPLWEEIPPPLYGGTERVVSSLTEGLVQKGHDVTLYACGSSRTKAKLVSVYPRPLFRDNIPWTDIMYPMLNITEAFDHSSDYDILHVHLNKASDYIALPLANQIKSNVVFTLHFPYPLNQQRIQRHLFLQKYKNLNFISISHAQRNGGENLNWVGNVYNGIDIDKYTFNAKPERYLVWLGRFSQDKGVKEAIQTAQNAKIKLILAGKVDTLEKESFQYYKKEIEPFIDSKKIIYVGEADDKKKNELFRNAIAFLNPIQWNEPFGLVMTEAMATGTPVISFANGAANEIITDNETGFLVQNVAEMTKKIKEVTHLDRKKIRTRVETYFSAEQMVTCYEKIYLKLNQKVSLQ